MNSKSYRYCLFFFLQFFIQTIEGQPLQIIKSEGFELGILEPEWTALPNLEGTNGIVEVVDGNPAHSGTYGVRMGKTADGTESTLNGIELHVDLAGYNQVALSFWIRDIGDDTTPKDALLFSDDGGINFKTILAFDPGNWCNTYGQIPPLDVVALASAAGLQMTNQFVIRWQQEGKNDFSAGNFQGGNDGFYLDDILIYVPGTVYYDPCNIAFKDDFEEGFLQNWWTWGIATGTEFPAEGTAIKPEGLVELTTGTAAHSGTYGVQIGNLCDGSITTNALDLHLDLSCSDQYEMRFWLRDVADATNPQDGLFFSNDGGTTFKKVLAFQFNDWCNAYGELPPIDIDSLASLHGLALTDRFVIRFQQSGEDDFSSGFGLGSSDGLYLDDIEVYVPEEVIYQKIPFFDGFEEGILSPAWKWRNATKTEFPAIETTRPAGVVEVRSQVDASPRTGNYCIVMGKKVCDEEIFTTNALDLHLNLEGENGVWLSFWLRDIADETQIQDAIYFSSDGGQSFKRAFRLNPSELAGGTYHEIVLNVDSLANAIGLSFTETFIIRFQQHGSNDFSSGFGLGSADGFYLDDIQINMLTSTKEANSISISDIRISPNPTSTTAIIDLSKASRIKNRWLQITDTNGRVVITKVIPDDEDTLFMDISSFSTGLYFIQLTGDGHLYSTGRMIKQ